jgi:two-component system response regulator AdeR
MSKPLALIVEDEEDLAYIFAEAAHDAGFETETIQRGDEALERLAVVVPELVILDLHLPRVLGTDILDQIRQDDRLVDTRVIVATADARRGEELREKADLVLLKPIGFRQLRDLAARMGSSTPAKQ